MNKNFIGKVMIVLFVVLVCGAAIVFDSGNFKSAQTQEYDNFRAERTHLFTVCVRMTTMPEYQPRYVWGREITYCNIAARDVLDNREHAKWKGWFGTFIDDYGYLAQSVFPKPLSILGMSIETAYKRAAIACRMRCITEVTQSQAQELANKGIVIWVVSWRYCHEAIVCPDDTAYSTERGPLIAQVGRYCGIFYARDTRVFGNHWRDPEIKYYKFPGY